MNESNQLKHYLNLNFFYYLENGKKFLAIMSDVDWDSPVLNYERLEILREWINGLSFGKLMIRNSHLKTLACYIDLEILDSWTHFFPKTKVYTIKIIEVNHQYITRDCGKFVVSQVMLDLYHRKNVDQLINDNTGDLFLLVMKPENLHPHRYIGNPRSAEIMNKYQSDIAEFRMRQILNSNEEFSNPTQISKLITDVSNDERFEDLNYAGLNDRIIEHKAKVLESMVHEEDSLRFVIDNVAGYVPSNMHQKVEIRAVPAFETGKSIKVYSLIYQGDNRHIFKCVFNGIEKVIIESPCSRCSTLASIIRWHKTYENEVGHMKISYSRSKAFFGWHYFEGKLYSKNFETIYTNYETIFFDQEFYNSSIPHLSMSMTHKRKRTGKERYNERLIRL